MPLRQLLLLTLLICSSSLYAEAPHPVVQSFINAYNERNLTEMLRHCDDQIRWMWVEQDKLSSETSGTNALAEAMQTHFAGSHQTRSAVLSWQQSGEFISVIEQASWPHQDQIRQQCSLAIYQLREQKILNVWYFPSHACD
ncbi:nuclear transport factor 2 family protein [Permianibacter aggregans]|uniref:SnoaL-like protein n=1 Tax=Permianibacter aggregans TaxID=1510150 RepID=A0A4R6UXF3_9GAMM|nr:nuclear transport factor 2 family protein [Permianibacter aggregans]QGX38880.1 hypothetical protein E2H98_04055 [Permianibacter aggregans]TDQ50689.1 hypothetical protein EV696_102372 [Permianibacter aggregans]